MRRSITCTILAMSLSAAAFAQSTNRTLTITSQCKGTTLRVGANGGNVQPCGANNSCPTGTSCYQGSCFWTLPTPTSGSNVLTAGSKVVYTLTNPPITDTVTGHGQTNTASVKWSGSIYAASGCDAKGQNCTTGMCPLSKDGKPYVVPCASGQGPQGPVALAEFTLSPTGADFYDVSLINGLNVAVSMAPASVTTQSGSNAYYCQTAGALTASKTGLQGCSWTFSPPSGQKNILPAVTSGGPGCGTNGTCSAGLTCGYAFTVGTTNVTQSCGKQIGWWTADELCTFTNNGFGAPINCAKAVPNQGTLSNLYLCNGANAQSCYQTGAASQCCGCPSWVIGGKPLITSMTCAASNSQWTANALASAAFVKNGCPTAYSFPYDDATSTFTCNTPNVSPRVPNTMNYTITFCPGGKQGY
jgi:hypothetical protein